MIAASAVLSAGLVAGLAATDAAAGPKPALSAAPIQAPAAMASKVSAPKATALKGETSTTAPCAAAWPYQPAACAADGRKVRIIALTAR
ncbi:MAG: hypothetical protein MIN69_09070 [Methylorubrum extorquens]|uniref:Uncharacterized protein n=2 Tax=Methylobacteriaceae TaxID=119045 RepID=C7CJ61_METED|nr:hypothetical protein [Methylorubrum extorquens]ABY30510.1 hypothetical protein Mext_2115 [Methylorubrum extorquens PA1]KQP89084.1 hypothetical protein ASF55_03090 [Methylobacterium sp. Leaf119]WIU42195.1 hypothetical protein KQ926_11070 [Methylorubrum extorquens]CAX24541.1 conserved protein of unknown function; putative exported protein [Methylorubrum extorquens DM4]